MIASTCRARRATRSRSVRRNGQVRAIDTAGLRRKGKVFEAIEKFSVVKTLQAIERAHVVVLMVDAESGIAEQDAHIGGYILEAGRALVVAINKWDAIDAGKRDEVKDTLERKLQFLDFASFTNISALKDGIKPMLKAWIPFAARAKLSRQATRALRTRATSQQPPMSGAPPRMKYAHRGGRPRPWS